MDILGIFLDILLKPPQPLMGLFFNILDVIEKNLGICDVSLFQL